MKELSDALKHNTIVTRLTLSNCDIMDNSATSIAEVLRCNTAIQELDLSGNKAIGSAGQILIANSLAGNEKLTWLGLLGLSLGESALQAFQVMFQKNTTLQKVIWRIDSRQSFALSNAVTRNCQIARRKQTGACYTHLLPLEQNGSPVSPKDIPESKKIDAGTHPVMEQTADDTIPEILADDVPESAHPETNDAEEMANESTADKLVATGDSSSLNEPEGLVAESTATSDTNTGYQPPPPMEEKKKWSCMPSFSSISSPSKGFTPTCVYPTLKR